MAVPARHEVDVLAVVAVGGAIGASVRYLIGAQWPTPAGAFPVGTLTINIVGSALIGVLMVVVPRVSGSQRLVRPFLGTGILGGFTTFSTYAVDIQGLLAGGHPVTAVLYLTLTPLGALLAVWATASAARRVAGR